MSLRTRTRKGLTLVRLLSVLASALLAGCTLGKPLDEQWQGTLTGTGATEEEQETRIALQTAQAIGTLHTSPTPAVLSSVSPSQTPSKSPSTGVGTQSPVPTLVSELYHLVYIRSGDSGDELVFANPYGQGRRVFKLPEQNERGLSLIKGLSPDGRHISCDELPCRIKHGNLGIRTVFNPNPVGRFPAVCLLIARPH